MLGRTTKHSETHHGKGAFAGARPGHVELTGHRVPRQRPHRRDGAARVPPDLSAARLGGARRQRDLGLAARGGTRGAGQGQPESRRHRLDRHHQPARDHAAVEPGERHADPPRDRLAGPAHRAAVCATACARGLRRSGAALHRPGDRPVLLGHQDPLAARQRDPRARRRRARRAGLRHHRLVAAVEAHQRPRARHRRQQRVAHDAVRHPPQRVGPRAAEGAADPRQPAAEGAPVEPPLRRDRCVVVRCADPDRRHRRRPAERAVRPGLLQGRPRQEHLRHRLLHADAQRRALRGVSQRLDHHRRRADQCHAAVRARRQRVHRRCGRAVVPRRPARHHRQQRDPRSRPPPCPTPAA